MTRPARSALDTAVQAAGALPGDGWLQRIAEGMPFGPIETLLAAVRGTVYARATAQDAGYGLETELAEPDGDIGRGGGAGGRGAGAAAAAAGRARQAARGGARGCARLARRAGAGADRGRDRRPRLADPDARRPGSRWRRGSAGRPIPISSTGSRSSGSTAANMTSASTATGSTRPGRSPRRC